MESIQGDVLTNARVARKDVRVTPSDRGGVTFQTIDYFDVLLEAGIITAFQAQLGRKYWMLREAAFPHTQVKTAKLDYRNDPQDDFANEYTEHAAEGVATEIYMSLLRKLTPSDLKLLQACCYSLGSMHLPTKMLIIQDFGENAIVRVFNHLEHVMPFAEQEALDRVKKDVAY